jgi:hypothetical protein
VCFDAVAPVIPSEKALEIGYLAEAKSCHQEILGCQHQETTGRFHIQSIESGMRVLKVRRNFSAAGG